MFSCTDGIKTDAIAVHMNPALDTRLHRSIVLAQRDCRSVLLIAFQDRVWPEKISSSVACPEACPMC
jgi:hypothetical protein